MALAACGPAQHPGHTSTTSSSASGTSTASGTSSPVPASAAPSQSRKRSPATSSAVAPGGEAQKVLVVVEENHSYTQMKQGMPYLAGLSSKYGYATHWTALAHPSEPNYLGIAAGSTFGITDDQAPTAHKTQLASATSVFDQALAAGRTAATYAESMPQNCHIYDYPDRSKGVPKYAVRHNPWVYFPKYRSSCLAHDFALTNFARDAGKNALPNVGFLIPNLDNDAHDGSLSTADAWLKKTLAPVLASSDFSSGKLVVVVTADEDDKKSGNTVLTSVLTPAVSHKIVTTPLTHYSLTRYIAQILGVKPLGNGVQAPDLKAAFGL